MFYMLGKVFFVLYNKNMFFVLIYKVFVFFIVIDRND